MGEITTDTVDHTAAKYENDQIGHRRRAYPSIEDQLDMIWHAINQDKLDKTSDFYKTIKDIKEQFPTKLK
jgi:4-hydroxyphenylpyruvate dioxygenase-like putative hemolysin